MQENLHVIQVHLFIFGEVYASCTVVLIKYLRRHSSMRSVKSRPRWNCVGKRSRRSELKALRYCKQSRPCKSNARDTGLRSRCAANEHAFRPG